MDLLILMDQKSLSTDLLAAIIAQVALMDHLWVDMAHRVTFIVLLVEAIVVMDWELNESDHLFIVMKQSTGSGIAAIPLTRIMIIQVKILFFLNMAQISSLDSTYHKSVYFLVVSFCNLLNKLTSIPFQVPAMIVLVIQELPNTLGTTDMEERQVLYFIVSCKCHFQKTNDAEWVKNI